MSKLYTQRLQFYHLTWKVYYTTLWNKINGFTVQTWNNRQRAKHWKRCEPYNQRMLGLKCITTETLALSMCINDKFHCWEMCTHGSQSLEITFKNAAVVTTWYNWSTVIHSLLSRESKFSLTYNYHREEVLQKVFVFSTLPTPAVAH